MLSQTVDFQETCDLQDQSGKITWLNLIPDGSGKWLDRKTQMPPVFTNWRDGGKSKQTEDNCAYMVAGKPGIDGKWSSTTCSDQSPRYYFILMLQMTMNTNLLVLFSAIGVYAHCASLSQLKSGLP